MKPPVGSIIPYLGVSDSLAALAAEGWLNCDGSTVMTNEYPSLSRAIGDTYGSSEPGSFNLPDLRGMFLRGVDPVGVVDPDHASRTSPLRGNTALVGAVVGSRQDYEIHNHQHHWGRNFASISAKGSDINVQLSLNSPGKSEDQGMEPTTECDGGGKETRPTNVYAYFLIWAG